MSILLTKNTRFIIQGITGREAINLTRENLDYGAKIVGGVTPGRAGRDVYGVPVYDCVRDAVEANGGMIEGSIVSVPPKFTQDAIIEALENDIKLIVVVTENVPRKQVAEAVELAELRGARIIGPNCLGIISPGECKMGGVGGPADRHPVGRERPRRERHPPGRHAGGPAVAHQRLGVGEIGRAHV